MFREGKGEAAERGDGGWGRRAIANIGDIVLFSNCAKSLFIASS